MARTTYNIKETYRASDGELATLWLTVETDEGEAVAKHQARLYFQEFGYRVVEDAKAKGRWPLPSDHPNAHG